MSEKRRTFDNGDPISLLCEEPEIYGLNKESEQTWIYPTNYSIREYQLKIVEECLLKNTLVSLPTGLGKTFIAAVVMYNFYRWYPSGKIIFMAPTKPLVKQQIEACSNIMAIPKEITVELTGSKNQTSRQALWNEKHIFFVTPQVLQNDLDLIYELGDKIKCLVFDEAHKAKGNHAYCQVIRKLLLINKYFRVLALSATPGNNLTDLIDILKNLLISHIEIRTDESLDVTPYIFKKSIQTIAVPLDGKLVEVRDDFIEILEVYTRVLIKHKIISGNCSTLTKGRIFMIMQEFQQKSKLNRDNAHAEIMRNLNICITLYHGYELLLKHGLRSFLTFFQEHSEKPLLKSNMKLKEIMKNVDDYLGPPPNVDTMPDGSVLEIPKTTRYGHPKFYKLKDVLTDHFSQSTENSKVIVFCEYRESVREVYAILLQHKPIIKPKIFLGQSSITQKQQINVVKAFRSRECNCLISTCIGEEGLDIGEVDLIVCFDISNKSPLRMIQRMGRTGRKKDGRVVILVTQGKEEQILKDCLAQKDCLTNNLLNSKNFYMQALYKDNPRMLPESVTPTCLKIYITIKNTVKSKNNNLMDMLQSLSNKDGRTETLSGELNELTLINAIDMLPERSMLWNKKNPLQESKNKHKLNFSNAIEKNRQLQATDRIQHSVHTQIFVSLLQAIDSKRYNLPLSQISQIDLDQLNIGQKSKDLYSEHFKQCDIRNMFGQQKGETNRIVQSQSRHMIHN